MIPTIILLQHDGLFQLLLQRNRKLQHLHLHIIIIHSWIRAIRLMILGDDRLSDTLLSFIEYKLPVVHWLWIYTLILLTLYLYLIFIPISTFNLFRRILLQRIFRWVLAEHSLRWDFFLQHSFVRFRIHGFCLIAVDTELNEVGLQRLSILELFCGMRHTIWQDSSLRVDLYIHFLRVLCISNIYNRRLVIRKHQARLRELRFLEQAFEWTIIIWVIVLREPLLGHSSTSLLTIIFFFQTRRRQLDGPVVIGEVFLRLLVLHDVHDLFLCHLLCAQILIEKFEFSASWKSLFFRAVPRHFIGCNVHDLLHSVFEVHHFRDHSFVVLLDWGGE